MARASDLQAISPAMTLHRLIAEHLPWPTLAERKNREHLRLEWRVTSEQDGRELLARTPHPFEDGAAALLKLHHAAAGDLVTMRHAGKPFDSFKPQPIEKIAARAAHRAAAAERVRKWREQQ